MDLKPLSNEKRWANKMSRSVFFLGALLFHLILLMAVATWVVFTPSQPPQEVTFIPSLPPKPRNPVISIDVTPRLPNVDTSGLAGQTIVTDGASQSFSIKVKEPAIDLGQIDDHAGQIIGKEPPGNPKDPSSPKIDLGPLSRKWGINPTDGDAHNPKAKFVVYVASYAD